MMFIYSNLREHNIKLGTFTLKQIWEELSGKDLTGFLVFKLLLIVFIKQNPYIIYIYFDCRY